jgi:heme/copper-type cytochrome/quinol oxidase subunit 3
MSPWPLILSISVVCLLLCTVDAATFINFFPLTIFGKYASTTFQIVFWLIAVLYCMFSWFYDVYLESVVLGSHTVKVQNGLRFGFLLFILSEVMFFVSFFWTYLTFFMHSTAIGPMWPPVGIMPISWNAIPFLNTALLLSSSFLITHAHRALRANKRAETTFFMLATLLLGGYFTFLQVTEYLEAPFGINDSVYGSVFFLITGFHGLHVLVGTIMILAVFFRVILMNVRWEKHINFLTAAWYWHFVDIIWIFVFILLYVLPN